MNRLKSIISRIDWVNSAFLVLTPLIAFTGTGYLVANDAVHPATVALAVVWAILTGFGITGGYHRLFSHKSYDAKWPYRLFVLLFGAAAFENSALCWSSDHRTHHKFVDTPQDPYNIKQGFFHAHMGWVMMKSPDAESRYKNVADLERDPVVMFQHRHYVKLGILFGFVLPTLIAGSWGDAIGGFFIAGFLRTVMNHHFTFSINSFAHLIGRQPYSDKDSSRDSWILALVTYGEGYHNYHHRFPTDYRNGIRFFHWDPTKWIVKGMSAMGLTYNLRKMPYETILRARLKMDEKRLMSRINRHDAAKRVPNELVTAARERIEVAYANFKALRTEYAAEYERVRQAKIEGISHRIAGLQQSLESARLRVEEAAAHWGDLCRAYGVRATRPVLV